MIQSDIRHFRPPIGCSSKEPKTCIVASSRKRYLSITFYGRPRSACRPSSDMRHRRAGVITLHIITSHNCLHPTVP